MGTIAEWYEYCALLDAVLRLHVTGIIENLLLYYILPLFTKLGCICVIVLFLVCVFMIWFSCFVVCLRIFVIWFSCCCWCSFVLQEQHVITSGEQRNSKVTSLQIAF